MIMIMIMTVINDSDRETYIAVKSHFYNCVKQKASFQDIEAIDTTTKSLDHLLTLEALYIRDLKPELNTIDEFTNNELIIKI